MVQWTYYQYLACPKCGFLSKKVKLIIEGRRVYSCRLENGIRYNLNLLEDDIDKTMVECEYCKNRFVVDSPLDMLVAIAKHNNILRVLFRGKYWKQFDKNILEEIQIKIINNFIKGRNKYFLLEPNDEE